MKEKEILASLRTLAKANPERLQLETVRLLKENFKRYTWVGIYNLETENELVLGPFLGKPSQHTRIRIDSGICGAAVRQQETIVIDDINSDSRYIACSLETKSEIVTPIIKNGKVVGEIDIDSNQLAAFGDSDRHFLEAIAEILVASY